MNKTENFIQRAKKLHGEKYDYSKVEYINSNTKVIIMCLSHGEFTQLPYVHLSGTGCNKCGYKKMAEKTKSNTEDFITKAKKLHGEIYDYSNVNYVNCHTKVEIICPYHGIFYQTPSCHLSNHGCNNCWLETNTFNKKSNAEEFIEKARKIHGEKYDYSKVNYINANIKVTIVCLIHGQFNQVPYSHLKGCGCNECGIERTTNKCKSNTEDFIKKANEIHGDKYDYSKVDYINAKEKVNIICKTHGEFEQSPREHLSRKGCTLCGICNNADGKRSNTAEFIEKAKVLHGDKYDYSKVEYSGNNKKVIIICKTHGEFKQSPCNHLKSGCSLCINKTEAKLYKSLIQIYPTIITQFKQDWCKNKMRLPFDFCIPEYNIIIELDGSQHFKQVRNFSSPEIQFKNDKYKEKCANENKYSTIRILQEDVYNDKYDWCKELCETIESIRQNKIITNVYLCKNNEYVQYKSIE